VFDESVSMCADVVHDAFQTAPLVAECLQSCGGDPYG
jgi:hypothetical protein